MNAGRAALAAWNNTALQMDAPNWDEYDARLSRYALYERYYQNSAYSAVNRYATLRKHEGGLYQFIRNIYNPVSRQNDLYAALVYGGSIDMEHLTGGSIPLVAEDERMLDAIRLVFKWSRFSETKSRYVRTGARLGDVFLKVVDEPDSEPKKGRVRVEVLHPEKVVACLFDAVGNITAIKIEYEREDEDKQDVLTPKRLNTPTVRTYTYTEIITKETFTTYRDGEPFALVEWDGVMVSEWANPYGFVPVVLAKQTDVGNAFGASSFHNSLTKIDELNDAASIVNDQIRKALNPPWYLAGVTKPVTSPDARVEERDEQSMLYGPAGSQPFPMVMPLDIPGALSNLDKMLAEIERDMPELALQRLREGGNLTAPGVRAGYSDAIGRIQEARTNYDGALVRALQMAVTIGGMRGLPGFEGFNLSSYDTGTMELYVKDRPVIGDSLGLVERLGALRDAAALPEGTKRQTLAELDYSQEEIDEIVAADSATAVPETPAPTTEPDAPAQSAEPTTSTLTETGMADMIELYNDLGIDLVPAEDETA